MLYCYFGHHKAATTYISSVVQSISSHLGLPSEVIFSPYLFDYNLGHYVSNLNESFLCYINADPKYVNQIAVPFRGFHVIRDPRDCIISAYYSHRNTHSTSGWPELIEHRNNLLNLNVEEGIIAEIAFSNKLVTGGYPLEPFASMQKWNYNLPNILELRYEDMINNYVVFFRSIFQFLGIIPQSKTERFLYLLRKEVHFRNPFKPSLNQQIFLKIINSYSFSCLADGRFPGILNSNSHYRKGIAGDYLNYFTPRIKTKFIETYPGLLESLNYEVNDKW